MKPLIALLLLTSAFSTAVSETFSPSSTQRVIILTDIEADPDDTESLVRLMLYSNQIEIQGIIATTSVHMKNSIHPESIRRIVEAYGEVRANLLLHEAGYPAKESLLSLIKSGSSEYGMAGVGESKNTEGSDWILKSLDDDDSRPLWISVWGGVNTLAQALYSLKANHTPAEVEQIVQKLRVYTISDQDDSGIWIRKNFPNLWYIVSPGGYEHATWAAINTVVDGIDNKTISNDWLAENIQQAHGPLGAMYPDVAYGMEGDTPAFLALIPNGLNNPEHPEWGGWGGRYEYYQPQHSNFNSGFTGGVPIEPEPHPIWTNATDNWTPFVPATYGRNVQKSEKNFIDNRITLWRWRDDFQNDFAARIDWCTQPYQNANHPPVPKLNHPAEITVKAGDYFRLSAKGSTDPDGDNLSFLWYCYPEAGSYGHEISLASAENLDEVAVQAPEVTKEETAHFILKLTDKGSPRLTRYQRVIVTIQPR